jgi:hypothetical protein
MSVTRTVESCVAPAPRVDNHYPSPPPTTYTVSGGLLQTNASGAEIWLAVHDHGPKIPAFLPDMMTTIAGGCENVGIGAPIFDDYEGPEFGRRGPNTCRTIQITFHPP